jgi:hypothetical protein
MKTFSRVAVVLIGMSSVAVAQPKADTKAPPPPAKPVAKEGPPATKPPEGMDMKPPAELAAMAKASSGTWTCTGQGMDESMKMAAMAGKMKNTLAVGGWWFSSSLDAKSGKTPFHLESYTTFDAKTKRWNRVLVETGGGWATGSSAGLVNDKIDWELAFHSAMGDMAFRDHEDLSDKKAGVKMWGEASADGGKTWMKVYEMACKK